MQLSVLCLLAFPPLAPKPWAAPGTSTQVSVLGVSFLGVAVGGLSVSGFQHPRAPGPHAAACVTSHPFPVAPGAGSACPGFVGYLFSAVVGICLGVESLDQVVALFTCLGGRHTGLHRLPFLPAMCEAPGFSTSSPALALA